MAASEDILSLQEYWITRVKNVAMKFEKEGLELLDEYNALKVSIDRHYVKSVQIRSFLVRIFPYLDWIRVNTDQTKVKLFFQTKKFVCLQS